jgi:hypothetical protein
MKRKNKIGILMVYAILVITMLVNFRLSNIGFTRTIISISSLIIIIFISFGLLAYVAEKKQRNRSNDFFHDYQRRIPQAWLDQSRPYPKTRTYFQEEKKINEYITLKLENGRTYIYVNGRRFIQCIRLILNIPNADVHHYDEIESIDEAVKIYDTREFHGLRGRNFPSRGQTLTPAQEFWGHCSNLQAWVEHGYDTRVLMSNISFPLLRELAEAGDALAKKVFKEEIAKRLESGFPSVFQYLINQGYIKYFTPQEFKTVIETTDLIKNLSSQPTMMKNFLISSINKFPVVLGYILIEILNLPKGEEILLKIISTRVTPLDYRFPSRFNTHYLHRIKTELMNVHNRAEDEKKVKILKFIKKLESQIAAQSKPLHLSEDIFLEYTRAAEILDYFSPGFREEIDLEMVDEETLRRRTQAIRRVLNQRKKAESKCSYCGRVLRRGQNTCDWCGHRKRDDDDFFPYPYIYKPPDGGGGGFKEGAIAILVRV